jgi:hypothetical protein
MLRQAYTRVGKLALITHQRYAHARQSKRAAKLLRKLKTYLRRTIPDIARKIARNKLLKAVFAQPLFLSYRVLTQQRRQRWSASARTRRMRAPPNMRFCNSGHAPKGDMRDSLRNYKAR